MKTKSDRLIKRRELRAAEKRLIEALREIAKAAQGDEKPARLPNLANDEGLQRQIKEPNEGKLEC